MSSPADNTEPGSQAPKALWTPPKKLNQREQAMAWAMFLESYKALLAGHADITRWVATDEYKACVRIAQEVYKIESGTSEIPTT